MKKRTIILATLTIIVLFIEVIFLLTYDNFRLISYSLPYSFPSNQQQGQNSQDPSSYSQEVVGDLNPENTPTDNPTTQNQTGALTNAPGNNSPSSNQNTQVSAQTDYELDFSKMANGTPVSSMFRIQNGIDDDWNPSWNDEKQMYRPQNVRIENGNLVIQAKVESNGEITSGRVDTQGFFQAAYGKFEVVAKFPAGIGTFPAIWYLPSDGSYFRDNIATPAEKNNDLSWQGGGELDVIEFLGIQPNSVFHDVHTYNTIVAGTDPNSRETRIFNATTAFHNYSITRKSDSITYSIDGLQIYSFTKTSSDFRNWPFDKPFYLILNLAMGGNWNDDLLASSGKSYPKGINNADQAKWLFYIQSIRHYPL